MAVATELLEVNNSLVPHCVYTIPGDGACLFSSLSYAMFGCLKHSRKIRADIVAHASANWERLHIYSMNRECQPYQSKAEYMSIMSQPFTYGTSFELEVAAEIYPTFQFEVYCNQKLRTGSTYGEGASIKRLKFTGEFTHGHFDVYQPCTLTSSDDLKPQVSLQNSQINLLYPSIQLVPCKTVPQTSSILNKEEVQLNESMAIDEFTELQIMESSLETSSTKNKCKRRARFTNATRKKQLKEASQIFKITNPHANSLAVAKYTQKHPDVHKESSKKYSKEHPEVSRNSTAKHDPTGTKRTSRRILSWKTKQCSGFNYISNINYESDKIVILGPMTSVCKFCRALKWKDESAGMCCSSGKVQLPPLMPLPEPLKGLILGYHPAHPHFIDRVRKYNACFQMTSFGAKNLTEGNFMPTFKVQGQVYHRIGSLISSSPDDAKFLQIYFIGEDDREVKLRCGCFPEVKQQLVQQLQTMLHENNIYIKELKYTMSKVPKGEQFEVVIHADRKTVNSHVGRYNSPVANEVALVMVGQEFEKRDIVLQSHDNRLKRISELHRAYDTLQYPLIFCHGEDGYHICINQCDPISRKPLKKTVSAANFYSFRLMIRTDEFNHLIYFRALFSQFLVDMFAKIETERLNFIRHNQAKLRADSYIHLQDAVGRQDANTSNLGQMVVLPSSFTGSPRYMHERTQDALTYVRHYGRPDLFITFTCNPKWNDIQENLLPGQKPQDRHDLIARVFHLKVKKIMSVLTKGCLFGEVNCFMYSVEWQKRGLPHIHILLWVKHRISPNDIDKVILAEIPDPDNDPILHEIVKKNMIHGPCGSFNHKSPCMKDGCCSKRYPRPLLKETQTGEDGYPKYRRLPVDAGGFKVVINGTVIDSRWVVPYNPVLLRIFNGHINVEFCSSIKSIKYVCKYINKGSDQAAFTLRNERDEVSLYESGRYISSSEAVWRILGFPVHERYPTVVHLAVHLENGQRVYFNAKNIVHKIANPPTTTLLAFFNLCNTDEFAKTLLYAEVPSYFVWTNNKFIRRKKGKIVAGWSGVKQDCALGRVYTVHPNNSECYHLRMLLHVVKGPTSFNDLKTVNGVVYPTYLLTCKARGLIEDDDHWTKTLEEASATVSPHKIRELFVVMLVFCQVSDPAKLWESFKHDLSEDIIRRLERDFPDNRQMTVCEDSYNQCLIMIEDAMLALGGQRLQQFGLPTPNRIQKFIDNPEYSRELNYDTTDLALFVKNNETNLTKQQLVVYRTVIDSIQSGRGKVFFLDAPGGTGKTYIINLILAKIRASGSIALAVASSGIAATLLEGGKTAHATFKLPLNLMQTDSPTCSITKQSNMAKVLKDCKLIVWDESTMAHKKAYEALDRTLKDIRDNNNLMGGLTVLLAGDFRQTLPVIPRGTRADQVKSCIKSSLLWNHVHKLYLHSNMRVILGGSTSVKEYSLSLLQIGDGTFPEQDGKIIISDNLGSVVSTLDELTTKIYPDIKHIREKGMDWLDERAILSPRNDKVSEINELLINSFDSQEIVYRSVDSVLDPDDAVHFPVEFLNTLDPPGLPDHIIHLKVGAPIMLLRNLNPPKLCNGTRLQVTALHKNVIEATVFTGCAKRESVFIPRIPLIPSDFQIPFKRLQFPVRVSFAMTINKSQGQTLKSAGIDLREGCFSHGQLYVACSRVSNPESLVFLAPENKTTNIVYKEVLL